MTKYSKGELSERISCSQSDHLLLNFIPNSKQPLFPVYKQAKTSLSGQYIHIYCIYFFYFSQNCKIISQTSNLFSQNSELHLTIIVKQKELEL